MANMEYMNKYERENLRQIKLKINRKTEPELLEWIEKHDNIQGYIKGLIMNDMEMKKEGTKMATYKIKPEYMDVWGEDANEDTVLTDEDLEMITRGWGMTPDDVMDQLIEIK